MKTLPLTRITIVVLLSASSLLAQGGPQSADFDKASDELLQQLRESMTELAELERVINDDKLELSTELGALETKLAGLRKAFQERSRNVEKSVIEVTTLTDDIRRKRQDATYIQNVLSEYTTKLDASLHAAERHLYQAPIETARLATENDNLEEAEVHQAQAALVTSSLHRLEQALGGVIFKGVAVDESGLVNEGTFALIGPAAVFRSADGQAVGSAEERLNSAEPAVMSFEDPENQEAALEFFETGSGSIPIDPTLGNAHRVEQTEESILAEFEKGGPIMWPILILASTALLVALYKWLSMISLRKPPSKKLDELLLAVREGNATEAHDKATEIGGPVGAMLERGIEHLEEPRELIEEVMYEKVLTTRLRLERLLPFIAICAASAPLLGLLGTVTGIINTFKLITEFGSGDVKSLSGGISEALITTKYGLIVAIPSLLLHAYLSRRARGIIGYMESAAVAMVNQVSMQPEKRRAVAPTGPRVPADVPMSAVAPDPELVRAQVNDILGQMLGPLSNNAAKAELASGGAQT
ncbi:MAG: MotA/TolQ/ExbB proton channel family protein [Planctomycetota bacterium]